MDLSTDMHQGCGSHIYGIVGSKTTMVLALDEGVQDVSLPWASNF
jgi:hypothetical protein